MVEADATFWAVRRFGNEVQGHEALFQSYFDYDLTCMEGGTETGFNIVEPTEDTPCTASGYAKGMSLTQVYLSRVLFRKEMPLFSLPTRAGVALER
jgi:hypothetical protein